jgi:excisionase family DNA binding protein
MSNISLNNLKLLSIKDLSKIFNISQATAYRIVDSRKISFYKIGGVLRFSEDDILKYLEENRIEPIARYK